MQLDNASGDQTASVVKNLIASGANIRYHRYLTNIGMLENFQYGLKRVYTLFFLCDDDIILPGFFEKALAGFEEHPDIITQEGEKECAVFHDSSRKTKTRY